MMSGRNGTSASGRTISLKPTSIRPKKKPAPPRPPQPSINRLQTSQSFSTAQELSANRIDNSKTAGSDLIDFKTPPGSPNSGRRNTVSQISTALKDFSYRVGASIFYRKSPLKDSAVDKPVQNPFSPPRPSVEAQKTIGTGANVHTSINAAWGPNKTTTSTSHASVWDTPPKVSTGATYSTSNNNSTYGNVSALRTGAKDGVTSSQFQQAKSSLENNNSKSYHNQSSYSPWTPAGASSSSNASSDRTSAFFNDFGGGSSQQQRYSNVPEATGKKELTTTLSSGSGVGSKPTIIRPLNKTLSQLSDVSSSTAQKSHNAVINSLKALNKSESVNVEENTTTMQRNYYDLPPDDEENGEDELNDSSMFSPPMPTEPPPPPPPEVVAVDEWVSSTMSVKDYPDTYSDAGQTTAYAIALYDFFPEVEGDLQLQAGDLVYLLQKIDDIWYRGSCGGAEGMIPSNFVNIMVPLPEVSTASEGQSEANEGGVYADVLYDFVAETTGDLSLQVGEKVKVIGRINADWLYGEKDGTKGQFPTAFVQEILEDLPIIQV